MPGILNQKFILPNLQKCGDCTLPLRAAEEDKYIWLLCRRLSIQVSAFKMLLWMETQLNGMQSDLKKVAIKHAAKPLKSFFRSLTTIQRHKHLLATVPLPGITLTAVSPAPGARFCLYF